MAVIVHRGDDADLSIRLTAAPITRLCSALSFLPPFPIRKNDHGTSLSNAPRIHVLHTRSHPIPSRQWHCERPTAVASVPGFVKHQAATSASLASIQDPPLLKAKGRERGRERESTWHGGQRAFALSPPAVYTPPRFRVRQRSKGEVS